MCIINDTINNNINERNINNYLQCSEETPIKEKEIHFQKKTQSIHW